MEVLHESPRCGHNDASIGHCLVLPAARELPAHQLGCCPGAVQNLFENLMYLNRNVSCRQDNDCPQLSHMEIEQCARDWNHIAKGLSASGRGTDEQVVGGDTRRPGNGRRPREVRDDVRLDGKQAGNAHAPKIFQYHVGQ